MHPLSILLYGIFFQITLVWGATLTREPFKVEPREGAPLHNDDPTKSAVILPRGQEPDYRLNSPLLLAPPSSLPLDDTRYGSPTTSWLISQVGFYPTGSDVMNPSVSIQKFLRKPSDKSWNYNPQGSSFIYVPIGRKSLDPIIINNWDINDLTKGKPLWHTRLGFVDDAEKALIAIRNILPTLGQNIGDDWLENLKGSIKELLYPNPSFQISVYYQISEVKFSSSEILNREKKHVTIHGFLIEKCKKDRKGKWEIITPQSGFLIAINPDYNERILPFIAWEIATYENWNPDKQLDFEKLPITITDNIEDARKIIQKPLKSHLSESSFFSEDWIGQIKADLKHLRNYRNPPPNKKARRGIKDNPYYLRVWLVVPPPKSLPIGGIAQEGDITYLLSSYYMENDQIQELNRGFYIQKFKFTNLHWVATSPGEGTLLTLVPDAGNWKVDIDYSWNVDQNKHSIYGLNDPRSYCEYWKHRRLGFLAEPNEAIQLISETSKSGPEDPNDRDPTLTWERNVLNNIKFNAESKLSDSPVVSPGSSVWQTVGVTPAPLPGLSRRGNGELAADDANVYEINVEKQGIPANTLPEGPRLGDSEVTYLLSLVTYDIFATKERHNMFYIQKFKRDPGNGWNAETPDEGSLITINVDRKVLIRAGWSTQTPLWSGPLERLQPKHFRFAFLNDPERLVEVFEEAAKSVTGVMGPVDQEWRGIAYFMGAREKLLKPLPGLPIVNNRYYQ